MGADPAEENTNGESDGGVDSPDQPGNPAGGEDRAPTEGSREQADLPAGADAASD